ncbi:MAG: Branched-chain amino acid transport ATP-binding protein LivF, partial [uncultured Rubrobacteraceae bacterium]
GAPRSRQHRDLLREHPGAQGRLASRRGGRDRHAHRLQRGRQEHDAADHLRPEPGAQGDRAVRGQRHHRAARAGDRRARDRAVPGGPAHVPAHDGAREPGPRRLPAARQVRHQRGHGPDLRPLPAAQGARAPEGGDHVRRRAADARHRPGPHGQAPAPAARRAVDGDRPDPRGPDLRDDPGDQPPGDDDPARGAERELRPGRVPARLRPGDGSRRAQRRLRQAAHQPRRPEGLPRHM